MQDAYQQGLSILALVAVQQVQTGLGPDLVLALVANRTSRTRVLVGAGGFFTAAAAVLWLAGVFPNQILLYAGAIGVVLGGGALTSTQNSLLCDYYPVSLRPRVILAQRAALVFGLTLCPLMVGALAYVFGWQASFFVLAAGALVFVVLAARLPDPVPAGGLPGGDPDRPEPPAEPATLPEAARVIATTRSLRLIYYSLPFLLGTVLGLTFYATAYYENVFHQDAAHRALLFGLAEPGAVIGLLIGMVVLPRRIAADPGKAVRTIAWLAVAAAAGAACLALAPDVAAAYAAQLVFASASAVVIAGVYAMLSVALPTRMLTLGFGLSTVWLTFGALLIGAPSGVPTINSLITNAFGYRASFWIFVPLFVIGASLLRSASRFVAEDIAKRKITEAADATVRQERADGTGHLLMVRSLDAGYDGVQVVFGVDLDVGDGEMVAVLGTNGAGKSTLMRAISGLVVPTAGEVMFDGKAITTYEAHRITEAGILQVPGGRGIFPGLTVAECLRVAGWLYDTDDQDLARATETVLDYFPVLSRRWHTPAGSLSGGEQQMLSLSMAFIAKPKLLIIDELSLGLAPTVIESLLGIVKGIHDQRHRRHPGRAVHQPRPPALRSGHLHGEGSGGLLRVDGRPARPPGHRPGRAPGRSRRFADRHDPGGHRRQSRPRAAGRRTAGLSTTPCCRPVASTSASAGWWRSMTSTSTSTGARSWACSGRTVPARPPSSNCSRASGAPSEGGSPWERTTSRPGPPIEERSTGSVAPSRPPGCGRASRCTSPSSWRSHTTPLRPGRRQPCCACRPCADPSAACARPPMRSSSRSGWRNTRIN